MNQNLTIEQYNKLIDCEVFHINKMEWVARKFVRRGKQWVVIAFLSNDGKTPLMCSYNASNVRVGGKILRYSQFITNPKNPEPFA